MIRKIIVFPNDPLKAYFEKGELAERYFNPGNFFQEVHVISLNNTETEEAKVKILAGEAFFKIHKVGKPRIFDLIVGGYQRRINNIVSKIKPHVLRAYNSSLAGWLTVGIGQELNIPTVISLHGDPERDIRAHINRLEEPKRWFIWYFSKRIFEPYALSRADRVICVYEFPRHYALKFGAHEDKVEIIYNRIDMDRFTINEHRLGKDRRPIKILCVGRIIKDKNPENIIRAVEDLDAKLTIIGNGNYLSRLKKLVKDLNIEKKVNFIKSVNYGEIHHFYREADIFASSNNCGGVSKPVIEAMASGLPVVINKPLWENEPELVGNLALVVENSSAGYKNAFKKLIINKELRKRLGSEVRLRALEVNGKKMEQEEKKLYQSLIEARS